MELKNIFLLSLTSIMLISCQQARVDSNVISVDMPFYQMAELPEFQGIFDDLLVGNEWVYNETPKTVQISQKAWNPDDCVYGLTALSNQAKNGETIHYEIYSEEERQSNPDLDMASLYCLHSDEKKPFVLLLAGGGFSSVCTPFESLPAAAYFNELGYTAFCLTYRVSNNFGTPLPTLMEDVAKGIQFIIDNAKELNIEIDNYIIGGFSAGGMTVNMWSMKDNGYGKYSLPKPGMSMMIYGYDKYYLDEDFPKAFIRQCSNDQYFSRNTYYNYLNTLKDLNISYDSKMVNCIHGFGLGSGTDAEGWIDEALAFYNN